MIAQGELDSTEFYLKSKNQIEMLEDESTEANKEKKKLKAKRKPKENTASMADLEKMILSKRNNMQSGFLNYMEAKYCKDDQKNKQDSSDGW